MEAEGQLQSKQREMICYKKRATGMVALPFGLVGLGDAAHVTRAGSGCGTIACDEPYQPRQQHSTQYRYQDGVDHSSSG